ncbi:MAG: hypothetical protein H0U22_16910 [Geodermatophilaceae bacterium]|nr:hypothetical protein [Geodermatophilaceae bacterium]
MADNILDLAPRPVELDGQRLGVLESEVGPSSVYLDLLTARLEKRHFLATVVRVGRPDDQPASPNELLEQLSEQCDVVIIGVCSSIQAAHDAAFDAEALERLSVPCALVLTPDVRSAAEQILATHGYDGNQSIVELPRSPQADRADVQALVEASFRGVERVLTASGSARPPAEPRTPVQRNGEVSCEC